MSNSQWHEDQAAGERALREDAADRARMKAERLQLAQVLKELFANMDCGDRSCRFKSRRYGETDLVDHLRRLRDHDVLNGGCQCLGELRKSEREAVVQMVERIVKEGT